MEEVQGGPPGTLGGRVVGQGSCGGSTMKEPLPGVPFVLNTPRALQVTASWERADASNNIYINMELSSSEDDYENSPAKWQVKGAGAAPGVHSK